MTFEEQCEHMKRVWRSPGECPCSKKCCDKPDNFTVPAHDCVEDDPTEAICEGCYITECGSCRSKCGCDI